MRITPIPVLHHLVRSVLSVFTRSYTEKQCLCQRAKIILLAEEGANNVKIAETLRIHKNCVGKWRSRFLRANEHLTRIANESSSDLKDAVTEILSDDPRPGTPCKFSKEQILKIQLLACQDPEDHGFHRSRWSLSTLCLAAIKNKIVDSISVGGVYHILESANIKPWKIRYYLHSKEKYEDYETYSAKIKAINFLYSNAAELLNQNVLIYSTDEMTGIQALERESPGKLPLPGMCPKEEFNYIRHGTTSLIGFFCVQTGKVVEPFLKQTRTSEDFVEALSQVLALNPDKEHAFILDNLNIHRSVPLVQYIARKIGFKGDLGAEHRRGILKNQESRVKFLTDPSHSIRFYFVPIHCSWMNQIEIWFGLLNRQLIRHNSFKSLEDLEQLIREYVTQHNELFAHPYKWSYNGVPTVEKFSAEERLKGTG